MHSSYESRVDGSGSDQTATLKVPVARLEAEAEAIVVSK